MLARAVILLLFEGFISVPFSRHHGDCSVNLHPVHCPLNSLVSLFPVFPTKNAWTPSKKLINVYSVFLWVNSSTNHYSWISKAWDCQNPLFNLNIQWMLISLPVSPSSPSPWFRLRAFHYLIVFFLIQCITSFFMWQLSGNNSAQNLLVVVSSSHLAHT